MDVRKAAVFGLIALTLLSCAAPAGAWFGPFGGCGFGCGFPFGPFSLFPFGLFGFPVPVPVPVPVAAPLCGGPCDLGAPGIGLGGCGFGAPGIGLGGCGFGAPGIGLGGCGFGNNLAIPGPM